MRKASPFEILRHVCTSGPLSRTDLVEMTEVAPSHISVLTRKALDRGFLIERGSVPSACGRRRTLLEANPDFAKLIGIDIGRYHTRIVVTDFASRVLAYKWLPTELLEGKDHLLQVVHNEVKSRLVQFPDVAAIGVSHSGVVDPKAGKVLFWPMVAGWDDTPLRQIFETTHGLPAYLVGDGVLAMAITEKRFGHGKGLRHFVMVSMGMGIGCTMFFDGHLYVGRDGLAGEFGHTTVVENGDLCSCGNRGCLELSASAAGIIRRVRSELERGVASSLTNEVGGNLEQLSVEAIVAAAKAQDRLAERVLTEVGTHLGTALANIVNLLNPEKIILGGKVPQVAGEILMAPLRFSLRHRALPQAVKNMAVVVSEFGEEAAALGTTLVAGEEVLKARSRELEVA